MASKGWFNIESAAGIIPETHYFEGDSAFKSLGLSKTTRLYGFIGCTAIGFVLSLLGSILLFIGPLSVFAILYVLGTVISLIATGFLIGFGTQLKLMFKSKRIIATVVLFASMVLVFVGAFVLHIDIFCLIFVIIQYLAFTYYSLTYIPGATSMIKGLVGF